MIGTTNKKHWYYPLKVKALASCVTESAFNVVPLYFFVLF